MGKRRGLGVERAYNKYVAPFTAPLTGNSVYGYKKTKRLITNEIPPEIIDHIPDSWRGNVKEPDPVPDPIGNTVNSRAIGFGTSSTHHSKMVLRCPFQRGYGYKAPGPVFSKSFGKIRTQFSFEMTSPINFRNYGRIVFRSLAGFQHRVPWTTTATASTTGYRPTDPGSCTLAPNLRSRTVNGFTVNTATRDIGLYYTGTLAQQFAIQRRTADKDDLCYTPLTLAELEIASWNANPFKYVNWHLFNSAISTNDTVAVGGASATSMQVYKDWVPPVVPILEDGTTSTATAVTWSSPFDLVPLESKVIGDSTSTVKTRKPENFLCHLGPGSVTMHFQNRLNTACDVDIRVYQINTAINKLGATAITGQPSTSLPNAYETQIKNSYETKHNSGRSATNVGFGGEDPVGTDVLTNPTKPFMAENRKFIDGPTYMKVVSSDRFRMAGGGVKPVTISLPEVCYDPYTHKSWQRDAGNTPDFQWPKEWLQPHSYVVYVALAGVLMPTFGATTSTNGGSVLSTTGTLPLDTQTCPASILVHGEYCERPMPCKSVSPTSVLQQKPELRDVNFTYSSTAPFGKLISGFVGDPPVVTTTNTIIQNGV